MATADHTIKIDPMFVTLFTLQARFQQRLLNGKMPAELDMDAHAAYVREQALALTDELHEALNEIPWKSWATSAEYNRAAYTEELADVFIFFMNMMLAGDVRPTEIMRTVYDKIHKNMKRQDDGYVINATTKCPGCKRSYDGAGVKCTPPREEGDGLVPGWCIQSRQHIGPGPDVMTQARGGRGDVDGTPGNFGKVGLDDNLRITDIDPTPTQLPYGYGKARMSDRELG
jgi:dimeric dUTPase (all-alpha-NTP-PPase superfamily)